MFVVHRGRIKKCNIVKYTNGQYLIKLISNKKEVFTDVNNVLDTIEEAKLKKKEIYIKREYKQSKMNENGKLFCSCCNKEDNDITVDHIKSLCSFGGAKEIRKDYDIWRQAWSFDNFQLMCKECNQKKNIADKEEFDAVLRNLNKKAKQLAYKKTKLISKGVKDGQKCSFGIRYKNNETVGELLARNSRMKFDPVDVDLQIARMDSRIIPLEFIL
ncbi:MAG: HNH endonuclease signature motif containing protein [Paraclostridium sp.]